MVRYGPQVWGSNVVWDAGGLVYVYDGSATNVIHYGSEPKIWESSIVWYGSVGGDNEIFLATPIPEPATLALLLLGAFAVLKHTRST